MAIKVGKESVNNFKLYQGVAALNIIAVNPTRKELEKLQGREIDVEPEYVSKNEEGQSVVRVTFYAKVNPDVADNNGVSMNISFSFQLTKAPVVGSQSGKIQIVDKYGRFAWATKDDIDNKAIPQYANGPANISEGYREAYKGEQSLIEFLINWLNIPNPMDYNQKEKKWTMKKDPSDSEISLDMDALFKGNLTEIKEVVSIAEKHLVKAAIGIRSNDEGKQYQAVYTGMFVKNAVTNYSKLDASIANYMSNTTSNVEFSVEPIHEHKVQATSFTPSGGSEDNQEEMPVNDSPWD